MIWVLVGVLAVVLYILVAAVGSSFGIYGDKLVVILVLLVSGGLAIYVVSALGALEKRMKAMEAKLDELLKR